MLFRILKCRYWLQRNMGDHRGACCDKSTIICIDGIQKAIIQMLWIVETAMRRVVRVKLSDEAGPGKQIIGAWIHINEPYDRFFLQQIKDQEIRVFCNYVSLNMKVENSQKLCTRHDLDSESGCMTWVIRGDCEGDCSCRDVRLVHCVGGVETGMGWSLISDL